MPEKPDHHPVVCFGETLWDILPHARLPGGAPMNVAYHLSKLGKKPAVISRVGTDDAGKELLSIFRSKSIDTSFFQSDYRFPTGKVFAEVKENSEVFYDIIDHVAWDYIVWEDRFAELIEKAEFFVFGSLVTRNPESKKTLFRCLETANKKVFDINVRPPYFNKKIAEALLGKTDILKLNLAELRLISDWFCDFNTDEDRVKLLKDKFDIGSVIVTKGGDGAILNVGDLFYTHGGYQVKVADTVGSGDSFLAGIIFKLMEKATPEDALDFASALGAFVTGCHGGCPSYEMQDIINLMNINGPKGQIRP